VSIRNSAKPTPALVLALRNSTAKVHCKHTSARPTIKFPGSHGMTPQRRAARFLQGRAKGITPQLRIFPKVARIRCLVWSESSRGSLPQLFGHGKRCCRLSISHRRYEAISPLRWQVIHHRCRCEASRRLLRTLLEGSSHDRLVLIFSTLAEIDRL